MSVNFLLKRSSTADKRPTAAQLDVGELALNLESGDPGIFFEDSSGNVRKVGPITVSGTAPNSSAAGSTGNSTGEGWLDTSVTPNELKVWDGSAWQSSGGGSGTPGGADTQVQYNDNGVFAGDAGFTYNATLDTLTVGEVIGALDGPIRFTAQAGEDIDVGEVVYISGAAGDTPIVSLALASDAAKMPAFGFAYTAATSGNALQIVTFGSIEGSGGSPIDTSGLTVNDVIYVSPTTAGGWTTTKPAGEANLLQNIGRVQRVNSNNGVIKVSGAGRSNATPNLNDGNIFVGNASNESVSDAFNDVLTAQAGIDGSTTTATRFTLDDNNATFDGTVVTDGAVLDDNGTIFFNESTVNGTNYTCFQGTRCCHRQTQPSPSPTATELLVNVWQPMVQVP